MNRKKVIYISVLLVITVIVSITYFSYAYLTRKDEHKGKLNIITGTLEYKIEASEISNNQVVLSAKETKEIEIEITSLNNINSKYELYYEDIEDVEVGYLSEGDLPTGTINAKASKKIKLIIRNNSNTGKSVKLGVKGGFVNNTLTLGNNENSIEETTNSCVVGTEYVFDYTGSVQTFTAPCTGIYKLEVWGAQGGSLSNLAGGKGGYSTGTTLLTRGENLYIYVGEEGKTYTMGKNGDNQKYGAFPNGGAVKWAYSTSNTIPVNTGGGSTHIATDNKTIIELGVNNSDLLIVAGGGGGVANYWSISAVGGYGGGTSGGSTTSNHSSTNATGGTQTAGGYGGGNQDGHSRTGTWLAGAFGMGGGATTWGSSSATSISGGGGGGYYGGGASWGGSGAGGSGYVGGVINGSTIAGNASMPTHDGTGTMTGNTGNGYAIITYIGPLESGYTWDFAYTGDYQQFTIPVSGTYKLEVWGAQGGDANTTYIGGKGGYASGNITLEKEEMLYVVVGGAGSSFQGAGPTSGSGGYNGGGSGKVYNSDSARKAASGGGATHIAKVTGTLASIGYTSFVTQGNGYIVAGGGGGGHYTNSYNCGVGGNAGGLTGLIPTQYGIENTGSRISVGGKQNESSCATGNKSCSSFGQGGSPYSGEYNGAGSGGGGGLYGGSSALGSAGAGGSSYIGGVINGTTIAGNASMPTHAGTSGTMTGNTGNGYARITFLNN